MGLERHNLWLISWQNCLTQTQVFQVVLVVGGWAWGWQDWTVEMFLPIAIVFVDVAIRRLQWAPFHRHWWIERDRIQAYNPKKDFVATQVVVLLLLVCAAVTLTWVVKGLLDDTLSSASKDLFVVLLIAIAFVSVAVACWTSLPQVAAIDEARQNAENLFITALDTVLDPILVVDQDGVINIVSSRNLIHHQLKLSKDMAIYLLSNVRKNQVCFEPRTRNRVCD